MRLLVDLTHEEEKPTPIFCDNNSTIALSKKHVFHRKSKHIETQFHFIRELVMNGEISLQFCKSQDQLAYIFIKPFTQDTFEFLRQQLGVVDVAKCSDPT